MSRTLVCVCVSGVTANSLHPGIVMTEVMRYYNWLIRALFNIVGFFFMKVMFLLPLLSAATSTLKAGL